jgi:hypothetical protein
MASERRSIYCLPSPIPQRSVVKVELRDGGVYGQCLRYVPFLRGADCLPTEVEFHQARVGFAYPTRCPPSAKHHQAWSRFQKSERASHKSHRSTKSRYGSTDVLQQRKPNSEPSSGLTALARGPGQVAMAGATGRGRRRRDPRN